MRSVVLNPRVWLAVGSCLLALYLFCCNPALAQLPTRAPSSATKQSDQPQDALGRTTPRGTVLGFLVAAGNGNYELAAQYLNTRLHGKAASILAQQLSYVLDRRLPARLNNLSNDSEGSLSDALHPTQDLVGTIGSSNGKIDIIVERVTRGSSPPIWLFSSQTLESIPDVYDEINAISVENVVPAFLFHRFLGVTLLGLVSFFVGLPLLYFLTFLLDRLLGLAVGSALRHLGRRTKQSNPRILPHPIRLLLVALAFRSIISEFSLPLLGRQFWSITTTVISIVGCVWLAILFSEICETWVRRRLERRRLTGAISLVRPARRMLDLIFVTIGFFFFLYSFGVNPTAALAGLGVGGIAVALAAQKTLENVIGGASIILDKAVQIGEILKIGDIQGTVEEIGLRSTRVRTMDRTVVTIPNGQMATMTLESISSRDSFWFHHVVGLHYETTASQLSALLADIRALLEQNTRVARDSVRVCFVRFAVSSLEIDIFAYVSAIDLSDFLHIQEQLLLRIMELVESRGATIAFPSQIVYLADGAKYDRATVQSLSKAAPGSKAF